MSEKKTRGKRVKYCQDDSYTECDDVSLTSSHNDADDSEEIRKSKIRDSNHEFARRMTILQTWSEHWTDYTIREGLAYSKQEAKQIILKAKKICCPIDSCKKAFTTLGGLKYHYARCNIERSFKCIACNPPTEVNTRGELLRHMVINHHDDLPPLNEEQKMIANSYLSCETRAEKNRRERKPTAELESSQSGLCMVRAFSELHRTIFLSDSFTNRPYKDWVSYCKDWELVSLEIERRQYYPPEVDSISFRVAESECEIAPVEWESLKIGDFRQLTADKRGNSVGTIFYAGGVVTSSAWLPKSPHDLQSKVTSDLISVSVNCSSMDTSRTFKDTHNGEGCIQFWTVDDTAQQDSTDNVGKTVCRLVYMIGHNYGTIFAMSWCPMGASWQPPLNAGDAMSRVGLLALACGDGQVRILSVPHTRTLLERSIRRQSEKIMDNVPIFRVRPVATLMSPLMGLTDNVKANACKAICWNFHDNQRLIAAGYASGNVALFDLANNSPILYSGVENHHVYQPIKSWIAHGAPVTCVAISSSSMDRILIASGGIDRQLKIWNPLDLNSCLISERAPITKCVWDFRLRGVMMATDVAFTSFLNRVSYRYPTIEGNHNVTVSAHRATVWGLSTSAITGSIATSDCAGEVFVMPQLVQRSSHKRNMLSTHSLYTMVPNPLIEPEKPSLDTERKEDEAVTTAEEAPNTITVAPAELSGDISIGENHLETEADFSINERAIANKPTKFLLPLEHRPIETYSDFKKNFGLEFRHYDITMLNPETRLSKSCIRAGDIKSIYCDRPCDYPFSSINEVCWSPNTSNFAHLLSASQVGLCRLDRVQVVEQVFKGHVDATFAPCVKQQEQ